MSLKHMKALMVLVVGLLSVGCATLTPEEKALRDSVVGEYISPAGDTFKHVLLENGIFELYVKGKKTGGGKWEIVNGKIHCKDDSGRITVFRINPDKSITFIADIVDGKRTDLPKESQDIYKKIN